MKFANNRKIFGASKPPKREGSTKKRPFNFDDYRNKDRRYRYKIYSLILMAFCAAGTLYHYHQEAAFADRGQMVMGEIVGFDLKSGGVIFERCTNSISPCHTAIVSFKTRSGAVYLTKESIHSGLDYTHYIGAPRKVWFLSDAPQENFVLSKNAKAPSWAMAKFFTILGTIFFGLVAVWIQFLSLDSDFKRSWLDRNRFEMD